MTLIHELIYGLGVYGKAYESMYEGSMLGAGIHVFAVWNYIIAKAWSPTIEINPELLAFTLGGKDQDPKEIEAALEFLQRPDSKSRSPLEGGRRIVKEGQFQYRVVNWEDYQRIRSDEELREYNRRKQAEYRANKKLKAGKQNGGPQTGETAYQMASGSGASEEQLDSITNETLPNEEADPL